MQNISENYNNLKKENLMKLRASCARFLIFNSQFLII